MKKAVLPYYIWLLLVDIRCSYTSVPTTTPALLSFPSPRSILIRPLLRITRIPFPPLPACQLPTRPLTPP